MDKSTDVLKIDFTESVKNKRKIYYVFLIIYSLFIFFISTVGIVFFTKYDAGTVSYIMYFFSGLGFLSIFGILKWVYNERKIIKNGQGFLVLNRQGIILSPIIRFSKSYVLWSEIADICCEKKFFIKLVLKENVSNNFWRKIFRKKETINIPQLSELFEEDLFAIIKSYYDGNAIENKEKYLSYYINNNAYSDLNFWYNTGIVVASFVALIAFFAVDVLHVADKSFSPVIFIALLLVVLGLRLISIRGDKNIPHHIVLTQTQLKIAMVTWRNLKRRRTSDEIIELEDIKRVDFSKNSILIEKNNTDIIKVNNLKLDDSDWKILKATFK